MSTLKSEKPLFEGRAGFSITARVQPPFLWDTRNGTAYEVGWPSIGMVPVNDARAFADAIIKACDWLEGGGTVNYKQQIDDAIQSVIDSVVRENYTQGVERGRAEERAEHAAQRDGKDALINHLTARVATLEGALTPFATGGVIDSIERKDYSIMRERIVDWHGPSDFGNARAAIASTSQQSVAKVKAAALREAAEEIKAGPQVRAKCKMVKLLIEMAERLEAEATND